MRTIGFVGLGAMGMPMAASLVRAGFVTRGYDLRESARAAFVASATGAGTAEAAASVHAAASGADALVLMVVNAAQAEEVLFGGTAQPVVDALAPGGVVVLMSTCAPASVESLAERVLAAGRGFVDAPVSGGAALAAKGALTIMASGAQSHFDAARPALAAMGDKLFHVGQKPGQGAAVKTLNQLLCGVHIAAAAEMMAFAAKMGVDPGTALEILSGSAASSWMLRDRGPRMLETEPAVKSAVDIFVKDLGIVLDAGRQARAALPLAAAAHQMYLSASGRGDGKADDSQVVRSYRALNGV